MLKDLCVCVFFYTFVFVPVYVILWSAVTSPLRFLLHAPETCRWGECIFSLITLRPLSSTSRLPMSWTVSNFKKTNLKAHLFIGPLTVSFWAYYVTCAVPIMHLTSKEEFLFWIKPQLNYFIKSVAWYITHLNVFERVIITT